MNCVTLHTNGSWAPQVRGCLSGLQRMRTTASRRRLRGPGRCAGRGCRKAAGHGSGARAGRASYKSVTGWGLCTSCLLAAVPCCYSLSAGGMAAMRMRCSPGAALEAVHGRTSCHANKPRAGRDACRHMTELPYCQWSGVRGF